MQKKRKEGRKERAKGDRKEGIYEKYAYLQKSNLYVIATLLGLARPARHNPKINTTTHPCQITLLLLLLFLA